MGAMMKGEKDLLTLQIKGNGPIGGITVTADSHANVKGYVQNPAVMIHANEKGKLDVGERGDRYPECDPGHWHERALRRTVRTEDGRDRR